MTAHMAVVGSLNMDLVARTPGIPEPGETIIGGEGANQAVAAAHLGARVSMVGRVGDDAFAADAGLPIMPTSSWWLAWCSELEK